MTLDFCRLKVIAMTNPERISRNWFEYIYQGNIEEASKLVAPFWTLHGGLAGLPPGPAGVRRCFADGERWQIKEIASHGSMVMTRVIYPVLMAPGYIFTHHIEHDLVQTTWQHRDDLKGLIELTELLKAYQAGPALSIPEEEDINVRLACGFNFQARGKLRS